MSFCISKWREFYDAINKIGVVVKKNIHDFHDFSVCELTKEQIEDLSEQANDILKQAEIYMTSNNIRSPAPKWIYNVKDDKTWASSPNFIYAHLI